MPKQFTRKHPAADEAFQAWQRPEQISWDDAGVGVVPNATTWPGSRHGPDPIPSWVVTSADALDDDLGVIKAGKEAACHAVRRAVPGTPGVVMVAKRYHTHGGFTRDSTYREGRRVKESREQRALDNRTRLGRSIAAGEWSGAEFAMLCRMWSAGITVPYPVELGGRGLLMEMVGSQHTGEVAPRLVDARLTADELRPMAEGLVEDICRLAEAGLVHGDLSPYNLLAWQGRAWLIDVPQAVEVGINPHAFAMLRRDVDTVSAWFGRKGVPIDADELYDRAVLMALSR